MTGLMQCTKCGHLSDHHQLGRDGICAESVAGASGWKVCGCRALEPTCGLRTTDGVHPGPIDGDNIRTGDTVDRIHRQRVHVTAANAAIVWDRKSSVGFHRREEDVTWELVDRPLPKPAPAALRARLIEGVLHARDDSTRLAAADTGSNYYEAQVDAYNYVLSLIEDTP